MARSFKVNMLMLLAAVIFISIFITAGFFFTVILNNRQLGFQIAMMIGLFIAIPICFLDRILSYSKKKDREKKQKAVICPRCLIPVSIEKGICPQCRESV